MTDRKSTAPPFRIGQVAFECWIVDSGNRYEWRALGDGVCVGRNEGFGTYWARANGRRIGGAYPTLKSAMCAALASYSGKVAA